MELPLEEFGLILGMDRMSVHRVSLDCESKIATLKTPDDRTVILVGERRGYLSNVVLLTPPTVHLPSLVPLDPFSPVSPSLHDPKLLLIVTRISSSVSDCSDILSMFSGSCLLYCLLFQNYCMSTDFLDLLFTVYMFSLWVPTLRPRINPYGPEVTPRVAPTPIGPRVSPYGCIPRGIAYRSLDSENFTYVIHYGGEFIFNDTTMEYNSSSVAYFDYVDCAHFSTFEVCHMVERLCLVDPFGLSWRVSCVALSKESIIPLKNDYDCMA
ncbi:hypothetical protein GQ457_11G031350 [Hibiscus cannabinus]